MKFCLLALALFFTITSAWAAGEVRIPLENITIDQSPAADLNLSTRVSCRRAVADEEMQKTCIAYRASSRVIEKCGQIFAGDDRAIVSCIGYNRSDELMDACAGFSANTNTKMRCLALQYNSADVRACSATHGEDWKLDCLKGKFRNPIQFRLNF